jgi:hypothetical protein
MKSIIFIALSAIVMTGCGNNEAELAKLQQQRSLDSMKVVMEQQQIEIARQKTIDSMTQVLAAKEAAARSNRSYRSSGTTQYVQSNSARNEPVTPEEKKRKGWSGAAKGAVIGAGVGAVSGALIDNKKGRGAIIGGVAGAGIGAGTGAIVDDAQKKKK